MAQLKDLLVAGSGRILNSLFVGTGIKIGSANELKSFGTGLSIDSNGALYCTAMGTVTGSGTSGYLAKWNGTSSLTNGPQLGSATTTYLRNDGQWATPANDNTWRGIYVNGSSWKGNATNTGYVDFIPGAGIGITKTSSGNTLTFSISNATTSALGGITLGFTESGKDYAVQLDDYNKAYVHVPWTDNNTTYGIAGSLSNHAFTTTLTATNPSGTSTSVLTLAAGSNITLSDDTTNKKITISATNTTYSFSSPLSIDTETNTVSVTTGTTGSTVAIGNHTHAWNTLTHVAGTAGQALVTTASANGWELKTLGSNAYTSTTIPNIGQGSNGECLFWEDDEGGYYWHTPSIGVSSTTIAGDYLKVITNGNTANLTIPYASRANSVVGSYTYSGGQQPPNHFGTNRVGFLMMNTTVNGNSQYKDWCIMDCYSGNDVGGGVAIGVNRQALGAYIMRSEAARTAWAASAELLGTHNYSSYALPLSGGTLNNTTQTGVLKINQNYSYSSSTTWTTGMAILAPNMVGSSTTSNCNLAALDFGKATGENLSGNLAFHLVADSGTNISKNWVSLGLNSHDHILCVTGAEKVGIKNTAPDYDLDVTGCLRATTKFNLGRTTYNVIHAHTTATAKETVIHTKITYASGAYMPIIHVYGYAYGLQSPIELKLGFYIYQGNMGYCGAVSMGAWRPEVYIFKETVDSTNYVAIGLKGSCYFLGFDVDVQFPTSTYSTAYISTDNWSVDFNTTDTSIIPATGDASVCIQVPYKSTLGTLTIDGATYNGTADTTLNAKTLLATSASTVTVDPGTAKLGYYYAIGQNTTGLFPATDAANAILTIHRYSNENSRYCSQLGFSNSAMYFRTFGNAVLNSTSAWGKIFTTTNLLASNSGLELSSDQLKVSFAGTGSATTVSRSDHTHSGYGTSLSISGRTISLLNGSTTLNSVSIPYASTTGHGVMRVGTGFNVTDGLVSITNPLPVPGTGDQDGKVLLWDDDAGEAWWTNLSLSVVSGQGSTTSSTRKELSSSSWYTIKVGNSQFAIKTPYDNTSTCLIEGTKILMADNSEKNIEDIRAGDIIMSYDPNTSQTCEAVVVAINETGVSDNYINYYFNDGTFLTIFGNHNLYHNDIGTAIPIDKWEIGDEAIKSTGESIEYIGQEELHWVGRKRHYHLQSSNLLYFANGILNAQSLTFNYTTLCQEGSDLPQSYINAAKADYDSSANLHTVERTKAYGQTLAPMLKEMKRQKKILDENKKLLADSDYIVAKFTEGLINAVEWLKAKAERANWRTLVNQAEDAYNSVKTRYDAFKKQYQATTTRRERFNAAVARDNACLDDLKAYYANLHKEEK